MSKNKKVRPAPEEEAVKETGSYDLPAMENPQTPAPEEEAGLQVKVQIVKGVHAGPAAGSIRVFTREQHGTQYKKIAEAYKERFGGEYVK